MFLTVVSLSCCFCNLNSYELIFSHFSFDYILLQACSIRIPLEHNPSKCRAPRIFNSSGFLCALRSVSALKDCSFILQSPEFNIILTFLIFWV